MTDASVGAVPGAFLVRPPARRVDVTGADRLRYLEDVTSQTFVDASPGDVRGALHLDPHGAPLAMFDVLVLAELVALVAPDAEVAAFLVDVLGQRTFLLDARFALTDDVVALLRGDDAGRVAEVAGLATRPGTVRPAGGGLFVVGRDHGGVDVVGPREAVDDVASLLLDAGARLGDAADLDTWRVASGVPGWGAEVAAPHLPEEAGLLPSHVHLAKGCYPGQEAVARMWMLGRPRRRIAVVTAAEGGLHAGWSAGEGRRMVTVTTVAEGGTRALAYVPSDATAGDAFTGEDGRRAEVDRLVGADAAVPGHDPAVVRRRDRRSA